MDPVVKSFRQQMPVAEQWAYFDHAAVAPLPGRTAEAMSHQARQAAAQGDVRWRDWRSQVETTRRLAARLVNASPLEIALVPSTTAGIGIVAEGYPWSEGDNVVTLANEFPSNLYPWLNLSSRGVETRRVPVEAGRVDPQRLLEHCDERTRIVAISWVGYASGWRIDVQEMAAAVHDRNALLMLDAIQGLGVFPLDVRGSDVDFFAADGHKWMLGPEGAGLFYIKRNLLDQMRPVGVGWHSSRDPANFHPKEFQLRDDAARYEGGTQNMIGFIGLGESLALLHEQGLAHDRSGVAEQIIGYANDARLAIEQHGGQLAFDRVAGHESGIVTFNIPGHAPETIRKRCLASGVVVSCRGGGVRFSAHAYNNQDDLHHLLDVLDGLDK